MAVCTDAPGVLGPRKLLQEFGHFVWDLHHHVLGIMRVVFPQIYFFHFALSNLNFVVVNQNQIEKAGSGSGDGP